MKIKILTLIFLLSSVFYFSQSMDSLTIQESTRTSSEKMNIIKTNITAYAFRNINITYERAISKKFSVSAGINMMPSGNIPFMNSFIKEGADEVSDVKVSNTAFTIEARYYLGAGYGRGFYIAPYYRYTSLKADNFTYNYKDSTTGQVIPLDISGKANAHSGGILLGAQWAIGKQKNWVLDLWIVGAHYGAGSGRFEGIARSLLLPHQQNDMKVEVEGFGIPLIKYKVSADSKGVYADIDGPWAGLRSGLSVGYRF